jgi:hypothetical protein
LESGCLRDGNFRLAILHTSMIPIEIHSTLVNSGVLMGSRIGKNSVTMSETELRNEHALLLVLLPDETVPDLIDIDHKLLEIVYRSTPIYYFKKLVVYID